MGNFWLDQKQAKDGLDVVEARWLEDTFGRLVSYCAWQHCSRHPETDRHQCESNLMTLLFKSAVMYKQCCGFKKDEAMMVHLKRVLWTIQKSLSSKRAT